MNHNISKRAMTKESYISKRHKTASKILDMLQEHPEIAKDIDSFCFHSGGHKCMYSIIHYLRDKFGHEAVSYSDKDLIDFIEEQLQKHKETCPQHNTNNFEAGMVGTQKNETPEDLVADYYSHGK